jgi:hypothetical protein
VPQVVRTGQLPGQLAVEVRRRDVDRPQRNLAVRGDDLDAVPVDRVDGRAQRVVSTRERVQRGTQGRHVQRPGHPQPHAGVVRDTVVEQPQASLRGRQRHLTVPWHGHDLLTHACRRCGQQRGQPGDRRGVEHRAGRQFRAERDPDPGEHPGGEDRVPAEQEEVVLGADPCQAEHLGEDGRHQVFVLGARSDVAGWFPVFPDRRRQRISVQLSVGAQGEAVERHESRRDHVAGQGGGDVRAQPGGGAARGQHVGHQPLVPRPVLAGDHHRVADVGVPPQHGLDLARLDAEPADLDLVVGPADELEVAVRPPAHQVPGAVHAAARRTERVGHEPLRGQPRSVEVAPGQADAGDVQLAGAPVRHRVQLVVEQAAGDVRDGPADRRRPARPQRLAPGGDDGRLGRSVGVDHAAAPGPEPHQVGRARLAADHQTAEVRQVAGGLVRHGAERDRRDQRVGDPAGGQHRGELVADQRARRGHDECRPGGQGHAQLQHRGVEARRGELQDAVAGPHGEPVDLRRREVRQAAVGDHDALGAPGRAGGVDDIGRVVRHEPDRWAGVGIALGVGQLVGRDHQQGRGVVEHEVDPLPRVVRIDRKERGAGFHGRELRDDDVHGPRQGERDDALGARTALDQPVREPVRLGVEFGVGQ